MRCCDELGSLEGMSARVHPRSNACEVRRERWKKGDRAARGRK